MENDNQAEVKIESPDHNEAAHADPGNDQPSGSGGLPSDNGNQPEAKVESGDHSEKGSADSANDQPSGSAQSGDRDNADPSGGKERKRKGRKVAKVDAMPDPEDELCAICMAHLAKKEETKGNHCWHAYHEPCFMEWMKNNHSCPACRKPVDFAIKNGKKLDIPDAVPAKIDNDEIPPEEEFSTEDDSDDPEFQLVEHPTSTHRLALYDEARRNGRTTRSSTRGRGPQRPDPREDMISNLAAMIGAGVGRSTGRGRGRGRGRGGWPGMASRPSALAVPLAQPWRVQARPARIEEEMISSTRPARRRATIESSSEEEDDVPVRNQNRAQANQNQDESSESSDEDTDEDESGEESGEETGDESGEEGTDSGESSEESDSELSDNDVMNDEPGPSRLMDPVTRKRKGTKKTTSRKKTTTRRKKRKTKRTTKKDGTTTIRRKRKSGKRKAKRGAPKRRRETAEERAEAHQRVREVIPSLSLNGADLEPVASSDDDEPVMKRGCPSSTPSAPPPISDPMDLLGQIMEDQTLALAPGRHVRQEGGRFVANDTFQRYMEKKEAKRIRQSASVSSSSSSSAPSSSRTNQSNAGPSQRRDRPITSAAAAAAARSAPLLPIPTSITGFPLSGSGPSRHPQSPAQTRNPTETSTGVRRPIVTSDSSLRGSTSSCIVPSSSLIPTMSSFSFTTPLPPPPAMGGPLRLHIERMARNMEIFINGVSEEAPSAPEPKRVKKEETGPIDDHPGPSMTSSRHSSAITPPISVRSFSTPLPPAPGTRPRPNESSATPSRTAVPTGEIPVLRLRRPDEPSSSNTGPSRGTSSASEPRAVKKEEPEDEIKVTGMVGPARDNAEGGEFVDLNGRSQEEQRKAMFKERDRAIMSFVNNDFLIARQRGQITEEEHRHLLKKVLTRVPNGDLKSIKPAIKAKALTLLDNLIRSKNTAQNRENS